MFCNEDQTSTEDISVRCFADHTMERPEKMIATHTDFLRQRADGKRFSEPFLDNLNDLSHPSLIPNAYFEIAVAAGQREGCSRNAHSDFFACAPIYAIRQGAHIR